jgi:hypothetical protein
VPTAICYRVGESTRFLDGIELIAVLLLFKRFDLKPMRSGGSRLTLVGGNE